MISLERLHSLKKVISGIMAFVFATGSMTPSSAGSFLPQVSVFPGTTAALSRPVNPPILKGVMVYANNPFRFDFLLDKGDIPETEYQLKTDANRLIKYFLASLTVPEGDLWVNLSPYEKNRIVPETFGQTEMGRDLLKQDCLLKQITATVLHPDGDFGRKFWTEVYRKSEEKFGTSDIPMDAFNKVWIVPEKAVVYENSKARTAYVAESRLKVMLESDYLALEKVSAVTWNEHKNSGIQKLGEQVMREIIIPVLENDVNEGKDFVLLRQLYQSLILADWYKKKIKDSIFAFVYEDKNKIAGVNVTDPQEKLKIYQQYLSAFKVGAFNFIKDEIDPVTRETIPRKYFSGGVLFRLPFLTITTGMSSSMLSAGQKSKLIRILAEVFPSLPANDMVLQEAEARSHAESSVWEEIGSGSQARVYMSPDSPFVLKEGRTREEIVQMYDARKQTTSNRRIYRRFQGYFQSKLKERYVNRTYYGWDKGLKIQMMKLKQSKGVISVYPLEGFSIKIRTKDGAEEKRYVERGLLQPAVYVLGNVIEELGKRCKALNVRLEGEAEMEQQQRIRTELIEIEELIKSILKEVVFQTRNEIWRYGVFDRDFTITLNWGVTSRGDVALFDPGLTTVNKISALMRLFLLGKHTYSALKGDNGHSIRRLTSAEITEWFEKYLQAEYTPLYFLKFWISGRILQKEASLVRQDAAMLKGGIDLTPVNTRLQTSSSGQEIKFHLAPAMLRYLEDVPGFSPVIVSTHPVDDLKAFLE